MCTETKIEMQVKILNKDGSTKHASQCQMSFGKKDPTCHRCVELLNGSSSRGGWQRKYYSDKKQQEQIEIEAIHVHHRSEKHLSGGCGPVCTFGDW